MSAKTTPGFEISHGRRRKRNVLASGLGQGFGAVLSLALPLSRCLSLCCSDTAHLQGFLQMSTIEAAKNIVATRGRYGMPPSRIDCVTGQICSAVTSFHDNMAMYPPLLPKWPSSRAAQGASERICLGTKSSMPGRQGQSISVPLHHGCARGAKWLEPPGA